MKKDIFLSKIWADAPELISDEEVIFSKEILDSKLGKIFSVGNYYYYYVLNFSGLPNVQMEHKNSLMTDFFGVPYEQMSLGNLMSRIHPDDISFIQQSESFVMKAIELKYINNILHFKNSYAFRIKDKFDNYKVILHQGIPIKTDKTGRLAYSINMHTDITHITKTPPRTVSIFGFNGSPSFLDVDPYKEDFFESLPLYTEREAEILRLFSTGYTAKEVAERLSIAIHTVTTHRKNILDKANCKKITEAIAISIQKGII